MAFVKAEKLKHTFIRRTEQGEVQEEIRALDGIDIEVERGQFVGILGANGSGKSTFAKHINALLFPSGGTLLINGYNASDKDNIWNIRQCTGMVFQNPDNQIIAGVVEEDVSFGPENLGVESDEIRKRVTESLKAVDMEGYRYHSPNKLSGGQKQKIAIAGVMAMESECIVFDEATAMLDPIGRSEVIESAKTLNRDRKVTIIWITHNMDEVVDADRIFVLDAGCVVLSGTPREVFSRVEEIEGYGLDVPQITRLAFELKKCGLDIPCGICKRQELVDAICQLKLTM